MDFDTSAPLKNRLFVTPAEALYSTEFLGLPPPVNPKQAAALAMCRGRFPLPTLLIMGRRMVRVADILSFAQGFDPTPPQSKTEDDTPPPRKRGRPSNAELAARASALAGEVAHD